MLSGYPRSIVIGLILAIGITLTLPHFAFGAARSLGKSGSVNAFRTHRQNSFARPFHRFGFVGGGGFDDQDVIIIIQQFQSAPPIEPREPAQEKVYVQPRWVDGGHGVEVLAPGYWTVPKQASGH
jgi:hypothetical protein